MIACLSLFTYPYHVNASVVVNAQTENTVPPVLTPAMEKKIESFKKKHPHMCSQKENKEEYTASAESNSARGIFLFVAGTLIIVGLVLLILMLL